KAIEAGYRCVKAMGSFVAHVRNATMTKTMDRSKIAALMERNGKIFYKRWGYPLRVVFILRDAQGAKNLLKNTCMDQNKVIVIVPRNTEVPYEHTNMKVIRFGRFMFNLKTLAFLLTKRSKKQQKGIDFVFTDDKKTHSFLELFTGLMPAQLVQGPDAREIETIAARLIKEKKNKDKESIK
ncbi:MAG TPA: hypothetical protein PLV52_04910, partial [Candidatus Omnitrophota bacterium]|nr:hypothetical protein [Candidatus Omnitrophota bacterium]